MPLHKFGKSDILYNQIKTHPSSTFFVYDSSIYYNNKAVETGKNVANVPGVPVGHVSMLELNVDRAENSDTNTTIGLSGSESQNVKDTGFIYPFVVKGMDKSSFRDMSREQFNNDFSDGDILPGSYKMSASISRKRYIGPHNFLTTNHTGSAIKNSLDFAKKLGQHYGLDDTGGLNVIQIPSIFYGSEIKKGTVDLKYYVTGTVVGRLKDSRRNGALIQSAGTEGLVYNDEIAGVVLYKEGFIVLSGSWNLATTFTNATKIADKDYTGTAIAAANSSWLNFGFGANDKVAARSNLTNGSASFSIDFAGTHKIPTVTMMAHANKGELNYSNNPTYVKSGQDTLYSPITGSHLYREQELEIKNIHSASYADPSGSLVKTTYITKVGIYDEKRKLIGIASLANPVKKTENRDLTFKLKLDI